MESFVTGRKSWRRRSRGGVPRAEGAGAVQGVEDVRVREEREEAVEEQLYLYHEGDFGVWRREPVWKATSE